MNPSDYERRAARRRALQKKRRRQVMMMKGIILAILLVILALSCTAAWRIFSPSGDAGKNSKDKNLTASADTEAPEKSSSVETETESETSADASEELLKQARLMAAGYDYDGAIALLKNTASYESNAEIMAAIQEFETTKASCVAVDVTTVPHIFYHSLLNDTTRAFDVSVLGQSQVDGMNAWMTTVEEFDKIMALNRESFSPALARIMP